MVLEIALGIIIAVVVLGLLEDYPQILYWALGGVILLVAPKTVLIIVAILAAGYGINYLFTYIDSRRKLKHGN